MCFVFIRVFAISVTVSFSFSLTLRLVSHIIGTDTGAGGGDTEKTRRRKKGKRIAHWGHVSNFKAPPPLLSLKLRCRSVTASNRPGPGAPFPSGARTWNGTGQHSASTGTDRINI